MRGEGGNDTLTGGSDPDQLDGGDGGDSINGLAAADIFRGGSGFDSIEARDGIADDVDCGPDDDSAFTDSVDTRVNCDPAPTGSAGGGPAPTGGGGGGSTTTALQRLLISPSFSARAGGRGTTLSKLTIKSIDPGSRLTAKCRTKSGKRCSRTRDYAKSNAPATLRLKGFEKKSLPVGARLEIRVTKPGMIGAVKVLTIRRGKKPTLTTRCMPPGASRPAQC